MADPPKPEAMLAATHVVEVLEEYLGLGALRDTPIAELIEGFGEKARAGGLPLARVMVGWRALHPLIKARTISWQAGAHFEVDDILHDDPRSLERFPNSPVEAILTSPQASMRFRLAGANAFAFPILEEFAGDGLTDYTILKLGFGDRLDRENWDPEIVDVVPGLGTIMSFATDAPDGFSDFDLAAIHRLKYMLAIAVRTGLLSSMGLTIAETYLGASTGRRVMAGRIRRGEGEALDALIWYCDLRNSTAICERLGTERYIPFLNAYFEATAGPVVEAGGEVLDFIGDAVLAIFPLDQEGVERATLATSRVLRALVRFCEAEAAVLGPGCSLAQVSGIAMDTGTVTYGNIGIPTRLTFSVIGPTVNKVARIERLTKSLGEPVLVTGSVASHAPTFWRPCGAHALAGVSDVQELFALRVLDAADAQTSDTAAA